MSKGYGTGGKLGKSGGKEGSNSLYAYSQQKTIAGESTGSSFTIIGASPLGRVDM